MRTFVCVTGLCLVAALGFGGGDDQLSLFPMCPPNCVKQPPVKVKVKQVMKSHLGR